MTEVTIRDLRNHGGDVVDRVAAGERVIVTRSGKPVAELRPLPAKGVTNVELVRRWRRLRPADPIQWRRDLDAVIDPSI